MKMRTIDFTKARTEPEKCALFLQARRAFMRMFSAWGKNSGANNQINLRAERRRFRKK